MYLSSISPSRPRTPVPYRHVQGRGHFRTPQKHA